MKKNSGTGFLRTTGNPNIRVQDIPTARMLCSECEQERLGVHEARFAQHFFYPQLETPDGRFSYDGWMSHFAASLAWRVVEYHDFIDGLDGVPSTLRPVVDRARSAWREFLLGTRENVGEFELHLLCMDTPREISPALKKLTPPNISRFIVSSIGMDVVFGTESAFAFAKIARLVFVGIISMGAMRWQGTRLRMRKGEIYPRSNVIPRSFMKWFLAVAEKNRPALDSMSEVQDKIVEAARLKNPDRVLASEAHRGMLNDMRLFGPKAFSDFDDDDSNAD